MAVLHPGRIRTAEAANPVPAMAAAALIVLRRMILPAQPSDKSPCTDIQAEIPRADRG
ncbi:MAG: hypothetical protein V3V86_12615 [Gammaproteobacteria bacterium]